MSKKLTKFIHLVKTGLDNGICFVGANDGELAALVNGKLYSVTDYRPLDGNGRQLRSDSINTISESYADARAALDNLVQSRLDELDKALESGKKYALKQMEREKPTPEPTQAPAPVPTQTPTTTVDPFSGLITAVMDTINDKVAGEMVNLIYPTLEKMVVEKFGILPTVHEIRIPERKPFETTEVLHKDFDLIVSMTLDNEPCYLCGSAGTGKSYLAKQLAKALSLDYYYTNSVTDDIQLKGFIDANGRYHDTQFYKAFVNGGVFLLDELDASVPETLNLLNNAIANGYFDFPTGRAEAHPDFHPIAAGNTYGTGADSEYTGRYQLDAATMNRFALITIDYDPTIELSMASGDKELVEFARAFRTAVKECHTQCLCTYRDIKRLAKFTSYMSKQDALRVGLVKGLGNDDMLTIHGKMSCYSNEWYNALGDLCGGVPF